MHIVFESKADGHPVRELLVFVLLSIVGLGINQLLMWMGADFLGIHYLLTKLAATVLVMIYNFITRKLLLEKH